MAGSAAGVLPVQLGFEQVHGFEEGFLGQGQVQPGGQFADGQRAAADLLECRNKNLYE